MKHSLFVATLLFCCCGCMFSQINSMGQHWVEYSFDPILTITIPDNFRARDTLGSKKVIASTGHGSITISAIPIPSKATVRSEQALLDIYSSFLQNVFMDQQRDRLVKSEKIRIDELTGIRFLIRETTDETVILLIHGLCLLVNGKMYAVSFLEQEATTEEGTAVREQLFASIQLPADLTAKNQMTSGASGRIDQGAYLAGQITGVVIVLLVLLFVAIRIWGRTWTQPDPAP